MENENETEPEEQYVQTPTSTICVRCKKNKIADFVSGTCKECFEYLNDMEEMSEQDKIDLEKVKRRFTRHQWHSKEVENYQDEYKKQVCDSDVELVCKKIWRHFKLGDYKVFFHGNSGSARISSSSWNRYVTFSHNPSWAVICHEFTHPLCYKKYKRHICHGSKKWKLQMARITNYCRKKNFWVSEIAKRNEPKPIKPVLTKSELRAKEVEKLKSKQKRYETKIKMYQNKLKKVQRKIKRFI